MTMVERMAEAMWDAHPVSCSWGDTTDRNRRHWMQMALAALYPLWVSDAGMLAAGVEALGDLDAIPHHADDCFAAMIDAAITEHEASQSP